MSTLSLRTDKAKRYAAILQLADKGWQSRHSIYVPELQIAMDICNGCGYNGARIVRFLVVMYQKKYSNLHWGEAITKRYEDVFNLVEWCAKNKKLSLLSLIVDLFRKRRIVVYYNKQRQLTRKLHRILTSEPTCMKLVEPFNYAVGWSMIKYNDLNYVMNDE